MNFQRILKKIKGLSHEEFAKQFLHIINAEKVTVPFHLCETQIKAAAIVEKQRKEGKGIRINAIPKSRQVRMSTFFTSIFYRHYFQNPNWNALIAGNKTKSADNLFNMIKTYHWNMPQSLVPRLERENAKAIRFAGWNSEITIGSADDPKSLARSGTLGGALCTEFPYWPRPEETYAALMAAIGGGRPARYTPNTIVVFEGTANGMNFSRDLWEMAKSPSHDFENLFIAWHELEEYRVSGKVGRLSDEERALRKAYKLDDEQILWRRWAIKTNCGGLEDYFRQEYPSFEEEAFLVSGRPYFDMKTCREQLSLAKPPLFVGRLKKDTDKVEFEEAERGYMWIWEHPEEGGKYFIPADVAGAATGVQSDTDQSVAPVFRSNPLRQVATICYRTYEDIFARDLAWAGEYYNNALLAPERNGQGRAVVLNLVHSLEYENVYCSENMDKWIPSLSAYPGWETTRKTRTELLSQLSTMVREHPEVFRDRRFWEETLRFVMKNGRYEAETGFHDDFIFSYGIGMVVFNSCKSLDTTIVTYKKEEEKRKQLYTLANRLAYEEGVGWKVLGKKLREKMEAEENDTEAYRLSEAYIG